MKLSLNTDYLKRVGVTVASVVVSVGLMAYVSYHLWRSFTTDVVTATASKSTVTITEPSVGYIIREELVLTSGGDGIPVSAVSDGEKVGKHDLIAEMYSAGNGATATHIRELENEAELLRESLSDGTLTLRDTSVIDGQILTLMRKINEAAEANSYATAESLRDELKTKLIKRSLMNSTREEVEIMIADIAKEITELKRSLGAKHGSVYAPASGYYYSEADGYESIFSFDSVKDMTFDGFEAMISSQPSPIPADSAGKIVTNHIWYMAAVYEKSHVEFLAEGGKCTVSFIYSGDTTLEMTVERIVRSNDGERVLVIFSSDRIPSEFDFSRSQPIEIVKESHTCFKIPVSAMRVVDGVRGVYVLDGNRVVFKAVSVISRYDDSYLLSGNPGGEIKKYDWLTLNDQIIIEGTGLYHGRILS